MSGLIAPGPEDGRRRWAMVPTLLAVAAGCTIGLAVAQAGSSDSAGLRMEPGGQVARDLGADGAVLSYDAATGEPCLAIRAGQGRATACATHDGPDVMLAYTTDGDSYALGVLDPQQRASTVLIDGRALAATTDGPQDFTYFATTGKTLPGRVEVFSADGTRLDTFTPAVDHAKARQRDEVDHP